MLGFVGFLSERMDSLAETLLAIRQIADHRVSQTAVRRRKRSFNVIIFVDDLSEFGVVGKKLVLKNFLNHAKSIHYNFNELQGDSIVQVREDLASHDS